MIEAMKQALEALEKMVTPRNFQTHQFCQKAYDDLRQAIAEAEKQERFFCERCGKRLSGGIHTCTPPAEIKLKENT